MATPDDPFAVGGDSPQDAEFFRGLNFLGRPSSLTLPGQEPSPPGGLAAAGPSLAAPSATGAAGTPATTLGLPGTTGLTPALRDLMTGLSFAERGSNLGSLFFGGSPTAGAVQTPSGQLTNTAPEILRDVQFPSGDVSAPVQALSTQAGAQDGEGGLDLTSLLSEAAPYLAGAGIAAGDILTILSNAPAGQKALDTGLTTAGGLVDILSGGATLGLGSLAAAVLEMILNPLFAPGPYGPTRAKSAKEAGQDLSGLESGFQQAAQSVEQGGGLGPALQALQYGSQDNSTIQGRDPVRTDLELPGPIAQMFGFTPAASGPTGVSWNQFTPETFGHFLTDYAGNPQTYRGFVEGSGDVGYLPGPLAAQVAQRAQQQTLDFLDALTGIRTQQEAQPAAPTSLPAGTSVGSFFPLESV